VRLVIQRVRQAKVHVQDETVAEIGHGLLVLLGVAQGDTPEEARRLARKTAGLRIFADEEGHFNRSLLESGGEALVVSQFTLLADARKGRRPNFLAAAAPEVAQPLVDVFVDMLRAAGVPTQTGRFGAMMQVELTNDGPVTLTLDSRD
jgi:D-tyrosyl-tRNA(Tyr) deacylase